MNWLTGVLGIGLIAMLVFVWRDEKARSKEQAEFMVEQQQRLETAQHNERIYSGQLQAGQQAAMLSILQGFRTDYTALAKLRNTPLVVQQRDTKERLIGAGLLTPEDTAFRAGTGQVVYDSVQQGAISMALQQRDRLVVSDSVTHAALGAMTKAFADTSQAYNRLLYDVGVWYNTGGLFSGRNAYLRRVYSREKRLR